MEGGSVKTGTSAKSERSAEARAASDGGIGGDNKAARDATAEGTDAGSVETYSSGFEPVAAASLDENTFTATPALPASAQPTGAPQESAARVTPPSSAHSARSPSVRASETRHAPMSRLSIAVRKQQHLMAVQVSPGRVCCLPYPHACPLVAPCAQARLAEQQRAAREREERTARWKEACRSNQAETQALWRQLVQTCRATASVGAQRAAQAEGERAVSAVIEIPDAEPATMESVAAKQAGSEPEAEYPWRTIAEARAALAAACEQVRPSPARSVPHAEKSCREMPVLRDACWRPYRAFCPSVRASRGASGLKACAGPPRSQRKVRACVRECVGVCVRARVRA